MTRPVKTSDQASRTPGVTRIDAPEPNQAAIDAAHGSTGWNAYDVWRNRVREPLTRDYDKPQDPKPATSVAEPG